MVSTSDCYAGGLLMESGILPLLKHTCGEVIGCHGGHQEFGRCCIRSELISCIPLSSVIRLPTLASNPRNSKQGYQWPQKGLMSSRNRDLIAKWTFLLKFLHSFDLLI